MKQRGRQIVFVDTSFVVALLDPRDAKNGEALDLARQLRDANARLLTTDAVLLEIANYFARSPLRREAITWIAAIRANAGWRILELSRSLLARAESRYRRHDDKAWSLTDCVSMESMRDNKMTEIATADKGFRQAGFRPLMA
jgi:uncharacterized protein